MPIVRVKRDRFVIMDKSCLEDQTLSFKAKGLHSYLMTLPDDWTVRMSDLEKRSTDGRLAVRSGMAELIESGYVSRYPARTEDGQLDGVEYTVYETKEANPTERQVSGLTVGRADGEVVPTEEPVLLKNKNTNKSIAGKKSFGCPTASFPRGHTGKILNLYSDATGGRVAWGRAQKALNMISDLDPDKVLRGFEAYVATTEAKYLSIEAFVRKAGLYIKMGVDGQRIATPTAANFEELLE